MDVPPSQVQIALKEWAITAKVLSQGRQILILRKGGIHQEDKNFRIVHPNFLLYETYEHQDPGLVKPEFSDMCQELIDFPPLNQGFLTFNLLGNVTDKFELHDEQQLMNIANTHLWTEGYAKSRFHWRPCQPLTVALIRVYRMQDSIKVPMCSGFGGCKSWVKLEDPVELGEMYPVVSELDYQKRADSIREVLSRSLV